MELSVANGIEGASTGSVSCRCSISSCAMSLGLAPALVVFAGSMAASIAFLASSSEVAARSVVVSPGSLARCMAARTRCRARLARLPLLRSRSSADGRDMSSAMACRGGKVVERVVWCTRRAPPSRGTGRCSEESKIGRQRYSKLTTMPDRRRSGGSEFSREPALAIASR